MKGYIEFANNLMAYIKGEPEIERISFLSDEDIENARNNQIDMKKSEAEYTLNSMIGSKIFEISEDTKKLLLMTKTPKINSILKLPYDTMFIDICFSETEAKNAGFDIECEKVIGIFLTKDKLEYSNSLFYEQFQLLKNEDYTGLGNLYLNRFPKEEKNLVQTKVLIEKIVDDFKINRDNILSMHTNYGSLIAGEYLLLDVLCVNDGKFFFQQFKRNVDLKELVKYLGIKEPETKKCDRLNKGMQKLIHVFVLNMINLINSPDVKYVKIDEDKKRNAKREKKQKVPIPARNIIKLTGELKRYVKQIRKEPKWHYNYRFWVRGHFRTLRSEHFTNKQGMRIWIPPHIRGRGVLVDSKYVVDKKTASVQIG